MNAKEPTTQELIDWLRACATQGFHGRLEVCAARLALLNSAVPVVEQLVEALKDAQRAFSPAIHVGVSSAIAAGQKFIKENGK